MPHPEDLSHCTSSSTQAFLNQHQMNDPDD
uniref:Uncharacterized protein n=1 Tax=Anguilla anguilla TaxID=7936 RepID=A0A0E9T0D6_ANGAN